MLVGSASLPNLIHGSSLEVYDLAWVVCSSLVFGEFQNLFKVRIFWIERIIWRAFSLPGLAED